MYIIIDGYNLLHAAHALRKNYTEQILTQEIIQYHKKKHHKILLIFDGGTSMGPSEKILSGITIVYSGYCQTADDYIISFVKNNTLHPDTLLVSSDQALINTTSKKCISSIDSELFYIIMKQRITKQKEPQNDIVMSYKKYSTEKNDLIDMLMIKAATEKNFKEKNINDKKQVILQNEKKNILSYSDKKINNILEKL